LTGFWSIRIVAHAGTTVPARVPTMSTSETLESIRPSGTIVSGPDVDGSNPGAVAFTQ
jgi:hypothetical protein